MRAAGQVVVLQWGRGREPVVHDESEKNERATCEHPCVEEASSCRAELNTCAQHAIKAPAAADPARAPHQHSSSSPAFPEGTK